MIWYFFPLPTIKLLAAAGIAVLVAAASVSYSIGTHEVTPTSAASSDYLLELDGVKDELEINSFIWGITSPRDAASGQATSKRQYQPIIRKRIDKASPLLAKAIDSGTHTRRRR